jgi:hypothetical protein
MLAAQDELSDRDADHFGWLAGNKEAAEHPMLLHLHIHLMEAEPLSGCALLIGPSH